MKRIALAVVLCLLAAVVSAYPGIGKLTMDQTAIIGIFETYSKSFVACDIDAFMALWDVDGVKLAEGIPTIVGKAGIYDKVKSGFDAARGKCDRVMDITTEEIVVGGDYAFARGLYIAKSTPRDGSSKGTAIDGKFVTIFRKQPDGSWLIYRDIPNSNVPAN